MNDLQSDKKKWKRYYVINSNWVTAWVDWIVGNKANAPHPGPVNNEELAEVLCRPDGGAPNEKNFYNINKPLFYFFTAMYGGGPAIIENKAFDSIECQHITMIKSREDFEEAKQSARYSEHRSQQSRYRRQESP